MITDLKRICITICSEEGPKIVQNSKRRMLYSYVNQILIIDDIVPLKNVQQQTLKGQCHEMVVEVRPWSGSLTLN
jgi:hypothetical protein